jgi:hypothetical protein
MRDLVVFLAVSFGLAALLDFWFLSVRSSVADLYALALYGLVGFASDVCADCGRPLGD